MASDTKKYFFVIAVLLITFSVYNYVIYTAEEYVAVTQLTPHAVKGQQLFQSNRCWSCHQIYGLGGYLGPDLTNVYSADGKGPLYVKAFLNSGVKSMPQFHFSEEEKEAIVQYLKQVDQTGYYPNYDTEFDATGWVKIRYKNEK